jgi:CxxC-x17-CxxC domain-containing protein
MAFDKDEDYERQMYKGDWKCSECGAEIKELPFEPDGVRPLYCKDCYNKKRQANFGR